MMPDKGRRITSAGSEATFHAPSQLKTVDTFQTLCRRDRSLLAKRPKPTRLASPLLWGLQVPKLHQQQQIVSDLQCTA
ncbi:hypothetical protein, partial [Mesorhizobium sp.]|uniref:hypothetical protein n=1 Tax=Mesorhizobium sp. TaxID=1871066 RepID=UPI00258C8FB3